MKFRSIEIDLTRETVIQGIIPREKVETYLGGRGLNAWFIHNRVAEGTGPYDPENLIAVSCGLLTGTGAPSGARMHINTLSPLTEILGSSNIGGDAGVRLRANGIFSLLITGKPGAPVYLLIENGQVSIRPADHLWGLDTWETETLLRQRYKESSIMAIGPGGENRCAFACIMSGNHHSAGRTGVGAVMGSKRIKAIVISGKAKIPRLAPSGKDRVKAYTQKIMDAPLYPVFSKLSNSGFVIPISEKGMLSTRNYREVSFEKAAQVDGSALMKYVKKSNTCPRCPVHCKADIEIPTGKYKGTKGARPDLEPIIALGPKCGMDDPEAVLFLHNLCNRLGLDVISAGSVAAFAMDLFSEGILDLESTGGIDLTWGNADAIAQVLTAIAHDQGIGRILKKGVRKTAQIIGKKAEPFAFTAKGLEYTGYDPRGMMGVALGYAVSSRGGDFCSVYNIPESRFTPERALSEFGTTDAIERFSLNGKAALIQRCMAVSAVVDSLGLCKVPALSLIGEFDLKNEAGLVSCLTPFILTHKNLIQSGLAILTLERQVNIRTCPGNLEDTLSEKFLSSPIDNGPAKGSRVDLGPMLKEFYDLMGWDKNGVPI